LTSVSYVRLVTFYITTQDVNRRPVPTTVATARSTEHDKSPLQIAVPTPSNKESRDRPGIWPTIYQTMIKPACYGANMDVVGLVRTARPTADISDQHPDPQVSNDTNLAKFGRQWLSAHAINELDDQLQDRHDSDSHRAYRLRHCARCQSSATVHRQHHGAINHWHRHLAIKAQMALYCTPRIIICSYTGQL
jgi:hypothetical protein